jgi:hypothetical protein
MKYIKMGNSHPKIKERLIEPNGNSMRKIDCSKNGIKNVKSKDNKFFLPSTLFSYH